MIRAVNMNWKNKRPLDELRAVLRGRRRGAWSLGGARAGDRAHAARLRPQLARLRGCLWAPLGAGPGPARPASSPAEPLLRYLPFCRFQRRALDRSGRRGGRRGGAWAWVALNNAFDGPWSRRRGGGARGPTRARSAHHPTGGRAGRAFAAGALCMSSSSSSAPPAPHSTRERRSRRAPTPPTHRRARRRACWRILLVLWASLKKHFVSGRAKQRSTTASTAGSTRRGQLDGRRDGELDGQRDDLHTPGAALFPEGVCTQRLGWRRSAAGLSCSTRRSRCARRGAVTNAQLRGAARCI